MIIVQTKSCCCFKNHPEKDWINMRFYCQYVKIFLLLAIQEILRVLSASIRVMSVWETIQTSVVSDRFLPTWIERYHWAREGGISKWICFVWRENLLKQDLLLIWLYINCTLFNSSAVPLWMGVYVCVLQRVNFWIRKKAQSLSLTHFSLWILKY